jgi:nicotinamide-nucleotide amidase
MTMTIEQLANALGQPFKNRGWKLVTAESCTGGGLAYAITSIAGASAWFERGFVTYSNTSKEELLGVSPSTLKTFGSVSAETAREMAEGALKHSKADVSIALTGIAGPDGGTPDKPVGTVWIACATALTPTQVSHHLFEGGRAAVREKSIRAALAILLAAIQQNKS